MYIVYPALQTRYQWTKVRVDLWPVDIALGWLLAHNCNKQNKQDTSDLVVSAYKKKEVYLKKDKYILCKLCLRNRINSCMFSLLSKQNEGKRLQSLLLTKCKYNCKSWVILYFLKTCVSQAFSLSVYSIFIRCVLTLC